MFQTINIDDVPEIANALLRPLGITRVSKAYGLLIGCLTRICEKEDRLSSVRRELYEPLAECGLCTNWKAAQSALRRASQTAWATNPTLLQEMAGYPLNGAPSATDFLEILYNAMVRGK